MEWNKIAERDCVTITRNTFRFILDRLNDEELKEISDIVFRRYFRKNVLAVSESVDLKSYLATVKTWSRYSGLFDCDILTNNGGLKINIRHEMGRNFSVLQMLFIEKALRRLGLTPDIVVDHHSISISSDLPMENGIKKDEETSYQALAQ